MCLGSVVFYSFFLLVITMQQQTEFEVEGVTMRGVFHLPDDADLQSKNQLPIVVMANGYATEWQFGTLRLIEALTAAGLATLNFDYRTFGQSDGEPRQVVDIPGQLEDFRQAIDHALQQDWVDSKQLVIWGSSLGGGHAISLAAEYGNARAMIAQVPHCCSRAAFKSVTLSSVFKGISYAIADSIGAVLSLPPIYLPVVAEADSYGVMNHPGWRQCYFELAKESKTWRNQLVARSLLKGGDYRPILLAEKIQCPCLLIPAEKDAGVPLQAVLDTADKIPQAEVFSINGDHFEVYSGQQADRVIDRELAFIKQCLSME